MNRTLQLLLVICMVCSTIFLIPQPEGESHGFLELGAFSVPKVPPSAIPNTRSLNLTPQTLPEHLIGLAEGDGPSRDRVRVFKTDPLPVHHEDNRVLFENTPLSGFRPKSFYERAQISTLEEEQPIITLLTVTRNPDAARFLETQRFIFGQSLQAFCWIIVNDRSDSIAAYKMLENTAALDPRVKLVNNTGRPFIGARNLAHSLVRTPYMAMIDDDDMFELTAYEKCVWFLVSNQNLDLCSFYLVAFGGRNYTWTKGIHDGVTLKENVFFYSSVMRSSVLKSGCRYEPLFKDGGEDWDFYLCLVEHGHWGATIPEHLFWYRQNPASFREQRWPHLFDKVERLTQLVTTRHSNLTQHSIAEPFVQKTVANSQVELGLPFRNLLQPPGADSRKSVLLVFPWMYMGGADVASLSIVRRLWQEGYNITIVCTLYRPPESIHLRPYYLQFTHDIFTLPLFLRIPDYPRFLVYLATSRRINTVFFSSSQFMYDLLPAMKQTLPHVAFVDYVHAEIMTWKSGGYPIMSAINRHFLDRTLVSSDHLAKFMVKHGADETKLARVYLGIAVDDFLPLDSLVRDQLRESLGFDKHTVVVSTVARLSEEKRPLLAIDAVVQASRAVGNVGVKFIMVGDGAMMESIRKHVERLGAEDIIVLTGHGSQSLARLVMGISDIFIMPSRNEGISLAVAEAMCMGLPVISTRGGGMPELIGNDECCGYTIESTDNLAFDTQAYARLLEKLIRYPDIRMEVGRRARERTLHFFDAKKNQQEIITQLNLGIQRHGTDRMSLKQVKDIAIPWEVLPTVHHAINNALSETGAFSDLHQVLRKLIAPTEWPYARAVLRATCGDNTLERAQWLDGVEQGKSCGSNMPLNNALLLQASLKQCGQWCIFDPLTVELQGWAFTGSCFMAFDKTHECARKWAILKPT